MSQTFTIKPAKGVQVRDPATGEHLDPSGATVPRNRYWLRRLKDGDVVEARAPKATKATSKE